MWIARDENGNLWLYTLKPVRHINTFAPKFYDSFHIQISSEFYPEVTWENSPKELVVKEEVVDASICAVYPLRQCNEVHFAVDYPLGVLPHKDGDKVKLIIVKEESV